MTTAPALGLRDRRALVAGALVIGALLSWARGLPALRRAEARARAGYIDATRSFAHAEARIPADAGDRAAFRRDARSWDARYLHASTAALATATLVQHVTSLADFAETEVLSVSPASERTAPSGLLRVGLRMSVTGGTRAVLSFLRELELGIPYVTLRRVRLSQPDPGIGHAVEERLRLEIEIEAPAIVGDGRSGT